MKISKIFNVIKRALSSSPTVRGKRNRRSSRTNNSTQEIIDDNKLIENYKRFAYACANINASACASVKLRIYVKTDTGDSKPRVKTTPISDKKYAYITDRFNLNKYVLKNLEEVVDHPALVQLDKFNQSPLFNGYQARLWTFLYLEVIGRAYWTYDKAIFPQNIPLNYWILPSQYVEPIQNFDSTNLVDYYKYFGGRVTKQYLPEDIIQFLVPDLSNPYISGFGPAEASFQANNVTNKIIDYETSVLDNQARPDYMASPKDAENSIGDEEAEQLEEKLHNRFGRGRGGGFWVPNEAMVITPMNWSPKDLGNMEISKEAKHEICNAYGTPIALLESEKINKATLEGALTQHALLKVKPTLMLHESVLNDRIIPMYDDSGRLLLCYDECVPEDKEAKMMETVQFVSNGIWTPNEGRDRYGYPARPDGDKLERQNVAGSGSKERDNARSSGSASK